MSQNIMESKPQLVPHTPNEKPRSRFEDFYGESPTQSPMIRITEEDDPVGSPSSISDLLPPSSAQTNKRNSAHFSPKVSLYNLENDSSSSILIPGGNVPGNRSSTASLKYVPPPSLPPRNKSPVRNRSPVRATSPSRYRSPSPKKSQPFNFKSTNLSAPNTISNARASHRKGHRYKHSSVSMNLFQEPKPRAPLKIPAAYPIPTFNEFLSSCNYEQKLKLSWSFFHLLLSSVIFLQGFFYSLHSFSTLAHLIFYDSLGCLTIAFIDIMSNFEVWNKSSVKFPFGLGRIEVLFGFALSVSLIFVGCDLISHFVEEIVITFFEDTHIDASTAGHSHSSAPHTEINLFLYEILIAITLVTTTISSRIIISSVKSRSIATSFNYFQHTIMSNPTHVITLVFCAYLALYPLLISLKSDIEINEISTLTISVLIIYMGWKVVRYLAYIVLLSFPDNDGKGSRLFVDIKTRIHDLECFKSSYAVENLIITKVHMGLVVVLVSIKMSGGSDDDELSLRYQIHDIVKSLITSQGVETTIDINRL